MKTKLSILSMTFIVAFTIIFFSCEKEADDGNTANSTEQQDDSNNINQKTGNAHVTSNLDLLEKATMDLTKN